MGGRGAGKTRAGAEWVRERVASGDARQIALVGPTLMDVREVMLTGPSGLLTIGTDAERPHYEPSRQRLTWPGGAVGHVFSAAEPERLRGPQFDTAWIDEIAAWTNAEDTWNMLQFGMRLGDAPRVMATTTPRPVALVHRLTGDASCAVTRGGTFRNSAALAPAFLEAVTRQYGGTRLGRQEIDGDLLEAAEGALWSAAMIECGPYRGAGGFRTRGSGD